MPIQLGLLDQETPRVRGSIWSNLPAPARRELVELFAALLAATVRPSPSIEEATNESLEDRLVAPRP